MERLSIRNSIIKGLRNNTYTNRNKETNDKKKIICVRLPYVGRLGDEMKKRCFKKVQKFLTEKVCFFTLYETKKLTMFRSSEDFIPTLHK